MSGRGRDPGASPDVGRAVPTRAKRSTACLTCRQPIELDAAIWYYIGVGTTHQGCAAPADLAQRVEQAKRHAMGGRS